jgi:hypothetical protein
MTSEPTTTTELPALTTAGEIIAAFRRSVVRGEEHWFTALLSAVRQWPLPVEQAGGREYRYLVGGEAFDWLLLAERLLNEMDGLIPDEECERLLFHGIAPLEATEEELQRLLGAKGAAYLNFYYGVRVEEALQLAVEGEVLKERFARVWSNGHLDDEVFNRIYGSPHADLLARFCEERNIADNGQMDLGTLNEFTYWLFKYRVNNSDPARVASDTRKGVAHLEALRAATAPQPDPER